MHSLRSNLTLLAAQGAGAAHAAPVFQWREALASAAVGMLIVARLQERSYPRFRPVSLVCACICTGYGFSSGAWPLGFAMGAYAIHILVNRSRREIQWVPSIDEEPKDARLQWEAPTRMERLFGTK